MLEKIGARVVVIFYVFAAYFFFANHSDIAFQPSLNIVPQSLYHYLTQGFLWKQLHLSLMPPQLLLDLQNPYNPIQNYFIRYSDATLYGGNYYLYFGPLPVLIFYLPLKMLTGYYFSDSLAVLVFLFLGFLVQFALLIKIKNKYFKELSEGWVIFSGFVLAFANNAPYMLAANSEGVYKVAISSAFFVMSIALYYLYNVFDRCKVKDVWLFSLSVSLTVACRPHFVFVCMLSMLIVLVYLMKHVSKEQIIKFIVALVIPASAVFISLALYNFLRFHSVWEFGVHFQLAGFDSTKFSFMNIKSIPLNIYYYLVHPLSFKSVFPYVEIQIEKYFPLIKAPCSEAIAGILLIAPVVISSVILLQWPKQKIFQFEKLQFPLLWFLASLISIIGTIFLFLTLFPGVTQRYETDFLPHLIFFTLIFALLMFGRYHYKNVTWLKSIVLVLGVVSIGMGSTLGLRDSLRGVIFTPINYSSLFVSIDAPIKESFLNHVIFSKYIKISMARSSKLDLLFERGPSNLMNLSYTLIPSNWMI